MCFSGRVVSFLCSIAFLILLSLAPSTAAQTKTLGTITGIITDPRGALISGAEVNATPIPQMGEPIHVDSGNDGIFLLKVTPGQYRVTISRDSFTTVAQKIIITSGETHKLDVRMALEPLSSKVVVTAQVLPLDASSSPAPVDILTREQIDRRVATSLPDLLGTMPGFSLGRTGAEGGQTSLFLDGGNSNYTKVLVDGTPANTPGGLIDFSTFTLDNIEKIEVVHGAESALYGSDAMDGVIQIFTRRGTTRVPEFTAYGEGGNLTTGRGGADLSGLLGRFDYSAGVSDMETQGQGLNDAFRNRTLSGNFGWKLTDTAHIGMALRDNVTDAGTPGQTLLQPANLTDSTAWHNFNASLRADFTTGAHWSHQLLGTESYNRQLSIDPFFPTSYQFNRAGFSGQSTYSIKGFSGTAGYAYEVENGFISYIGMHERRNNQAGFVDARWQPVGRLTLNAGARAEDNANFGTRVVPRVGAAYALRIAKGAFGDTRLRASYGQGIVEPRFDQSFGSDPCFPGNPTLLPEQSRTVHAGIEQKLASDRVRVTVDYFDNRFRNIVSFGPLSAPPPGCPLSEFNSFGAGTFFNTDSSRARGGNLTAEGRITRWLTAAGSYTYDPTRVLAAPNAFDPTEVPGNRLLRRPVNSGNLTLNAAFKRMNWNISGYFTGRRTDSDFMFLGFNNNPGYARVDTSASFAIFRGLSIYGRVANLADKKYQDALGFPALGREFRIGMKYTTHNE